jgi:hypothetical protein
MSSARRREPASLALALVAVMLAVAGCGGGAGDSTSSGSAPAATVATSAQTKTSTGTASKPGHAAKPAGMVAQANAICTRRGLELVAATAKSRSEFAPDAARRVVVERARLGELSKLTPTHAIAKDWGEFMAATRQALTHITSLAEAAAHGDESQLKSAGAQYVLAGHRMRAAAIAAKVERCAEYG